MFIEGNLFSSKATTSLAVKWNEEKTVPGCYLLDVQNVSCVSERGLAHPPRTGSDVIVIVTLVSPRVQS